MFAQIHLWETGILLIGIGFVIISVYAGKTLKNLSKTITDIDNIIVDNKQSINEIVADVNSITKSLTEVVADVEQTVASTKSSVSDIRSTVSSTKNYLLKPTLTSLNIARKLIKFTLSLLRKQGSKKEKK